VQQSARLPSITTAGTPPDAKLLCSRRHVGLLHVEDLDLAGWESDAVHQLKGLVAHPRSPH
jgi:hypothetical protein